MHRVRGEVLAAVSGASSLLAAGDMLLVATVGVDWLDSPARVASAPEAATIRNTANTWGVPHTMRLLMPVT